MNIRPKFFSAAAVVFVSGLIGVSCKHESDPISADLVVSVKAEATMDAQQDEIDDIAIGQLVAKSTIGGRMLVSSSDDRVACAKITANISEDKTGTIEIDFGQMQDGTPNPGGCIDPRGNSRKGKINIAWQGAAWYKQGSHILITLDGYTINSVLIEGSRNIENITDDATPLMQKSTVVATHLATWPDATTATRAINKTRVWDVLAETVTVTQTPGGDFAASGTTRKGNTYQVEITDGLIFTSSCVVTSKTYIPVRGSEIFTVNGSGSMTFNFGDGTCDNIFNVTYNGISQTVAAVN